LLLDTRGEVWVTDFGLARVQAEAGLTLTLTGDVLGTLRYMSPEQALGRRTLVDHRSDLYSLGVTLYELLTLRPAIGGSDRQEILRRIAFEEPTEPRRHNPAVPRELETIILKAMSKEPAERYTTAQELADDLTRFLEHRPIKARRPSPLERAAKWARRHSTVVVSAVL
jgi:serine/threonine protein kinase